VILGALPSMSLATESWTTKADMLTPRVSLSTSAVDISPVPWGDGIVDAGDLLVLAEYMVEYANGLDDIQ